MIGSIESGSTYPAGLGTGPKTNGSARLKVCAGGVGGLGARTEGHGLQSVPGENEEGEGSDNAKWYAPEISIEERRLVQKKSKCFLPGRIPQ
ncbi:hypothetical protein Tco_1320939 [Tanacetum coccineum]